MKKLLTSAFCLAIMAATPAYAQSAFVFVIGDAPSAEQERETSAPTQEALVERAIEQACARPSLQAVKMQMMYRECIAELRAELASGSENSIRLAAR